MRQNTFAVKAESSAKGVFDGQADRNHSRHSFWFPIYEGIFEHCSTIQDALWLYTWFIARTTKENQGEGIVLGGMPVADERPARELGTTVKVIRRWRKLLVGGGYIRAVRTGRGYKYTVLKSKRDRPKRPISMAEMCPRGEVRPSLSGKSEVPRSTRSVTSNKKIQKENTVAEETEAAAPAFASLLLREKDQTRKKEHPAWEEISMVPTGSRDFGAVWENAWDNRDQSVSGAMERAIQTCGHRGIKVPPPFFQAKRKIEAREGESAEPFYFPRHPIPD
jgi:hypothetical protein